MYYLCRRGPRNRIRIWRQRQRRRRRQQLAWRTKVGIFFFKNVNGFLLTLGELASGYLHPCNHSVNYKPQCELVMYCYSCRISVSFSVCLSDFSQTRPHVSISSCRHLEHCQVRTEFELQNYWTSYIKMRCFFRILEQHGTHCGTL
jgi:hypothetical protein